MADLQSDIGFIEPQSDTQSDAGDSTYDDDICSTQSLTSSILEYEEMHGRKFHAYHAGKYYLPSDEGEQDRLDIFYHGVRLALNNRLFYAPIDSPKDVLDIGTGTGIWAMDVADEYPAAEVVGIDLSAIQPRYVPPNLQFEVCDAEEPWGYRPGRFDLVHTRIMYDYTLKDWPNFYKQAFEYLKPGGWVENQEFTHHRRSDDNTISPNSRLSHWESEWTRAINKIGLPGAADPGKIQQQMTEAGFINITKLEFKLPLGPWPKDKRLRQAGVFGMANLLEGMHGLSLKLFTGVLGYTLEELEVLLMECKTELKKKSSHAYYPIYVVYGQKPPTGLES